MSNFNFASMN